MKTKGALIREFNQPWTIEEIEIGDPQPGEVKVQMEASGMCHSDHHLVTGGIPMLGFPVLGGHEGAGIVTEVGDGVDSVDEVDPHNQRLHCNEHGWFSFSGTPLSAQNSDKFVLKPSKAIMVAACCGHQWLNGAKTSPRRLCLRELLLASRLNWHNFAKPLAALLP